MMFGEGGSQLSHLLRVCLDQREKSHINKEMIRENKVCFFIPSNITCRALGPEPVTASDGVLLVATARGGGGGWVVGGKRCLLIPTLGEPCDCCSKNDLDTAGYLRFLCFLFSVLVFFSILINCQALSPRSPHVSRVFVCVITNFF